MDNTNKPENQEHLDPEFRSLENKVGTLERQLAEQQDLLRDYEKSLVERIADVDDDRRTTASQLQRAWQSQLEEINDRFKRQMVLVIGALVLFMVAVGVVLFLAYHQANSDRQSLSDDLAELRQELGRTSGTQADTDSMRAELTRLSATVNEISASPGRQDEKQVDRLYANFEDERIARKEADAVIGAEVQRLQARQESLMREFEALRKTLETAQTTKAASGQVLSDSAPAEEAKPDSAQKPPATTVESPVEFSPSSPAEGQGSTEETSVAVLEEPFSDDPENTVTAVSPEVETPKTLVLADRTYALQLIGYNSLDTLLSFADRDDLPERLYYREEAVKGQPWFALIHSLHPDYASAYAELQKLSPELVALEPWIRSTPAGVELTVIDRGSQR